MELQRKLEKVIKSTQKLVQPAQTKNQESKEVTKLHSESGSDNRER